jgi:hypothetical protein
MRLPISVLKADPKNPRKISDEALAGLGLSLETFGPLDIVWNETTKQLVSGHQRVDRLKAAGATEFVRDGEWCYIEHPKNKERFPVRIVAWDEVRQRMANLVANNPALSGDFTEDAIEQARSLEDEAHYHELQLYKLIAAGEAKLDASSADGEGSKDQSAELRENFQIVVTCADETHQSTLLERFIEEGLKCRALI